MLRVAGSSDNQPHAGAAGMVPPPPLSAESEDTEPASPRSVSPPSSVEPDSPEPICRLDVEQELSSLYAEIDTVRQRLAANLIRYQMGCRLMEREIAQLKQQIEKIAAFDPSLVQLMTDLSDDNPNEPLSPGGVRRKFSSLSYPSITYRRICQEKFAEMIRLQKEKTRLKEQFLIPARRKVTQAREEYAKSVDALYRATEERFHAILQEGLHQWVQECSKQSTGREFVVVQKIQEAYYLSKNQLDLSGFALTSLPSSIAAIRSLEHLSVPNNQLTQLPSTIRFMPQLICLDLSGNQFDHIPAHIPKTVRCVFFQNNPASHNEAEIQACKERMEPDFVIYTNLEVVT